MKHIISTNGNEINFALSGERKLVISTKPISVTELELITLQTRLGSQITVVASLEAENAPVVTPEEVTPEEVTPEEVTPEEVTPEEVVPSLDALDDPEEDIV